ncbi:MAG: phosphoribosylformylglycinamidine cyclo-ligase [Myxococcales bacterium]|nr:MAG: phosphoribosylformylglycinamidine cyclo-ligase [Myxococcales bacterium]
MTKPTTYRDAGVDIDEGNRMVELIKPIVKSTFRPEVLGGIGGFGALFKLDLSKYKKPLLVSSTDGVGTKLKIAFMTGKHRTVGIDLVAMSVNDLVVQGAEPLFFLDYFATGKLAAETAADVVAGIAEGCKQAGCALIGGETAELPGFYQPGEYDLAGFAVGIVDEAELIDGRNVRPGDAVFTLPSSGLHSNGYSLARKIVFEQLKLAPDAHVAELGATAGDALLTPTKIYVKTVLAMAKTGKVKALAHITGGGFYENIPRVVPQNTRIVVEKAKVPISPIFRFLMEKGPVAEREMFRTFNMGAGMIVIAAPEDADALAAAARAHGETLIPIGRVEATNEPSHVVIV